MPDLKSLDQNRLREYKSILTKRYQQFKAKNLNMDMTRGKPCPEQLDLSLDMLDIVNSRQFKAGDGTDCRNYGGVEGLAEARVLFANLLGVEPNEIIISGNASLTLMHDIVLRAMVLGMVDSDTPWCNLPKVKWLAPTPGYDRHFAVCEYLGIEMIPIEMKADGPDMDAVEKLVAEDESIKGIWCVPVYSNPSGAVYSDEVVDRLAAMKTKARDFRVMADNAYAFHHLTDDPKKLKNMLKACKEAGNPDRIFIFGSTSKITFAGAGISMVAGSVKNIDYVKKHISLQTIGPDKMNQLRHVLFLKNVQGVEDLMKKHAVIIKPKFDAVQEVLDRELGDKGVADWSKPEGGYFISVNTPDGCAKEVVRMAGEIGVKFTPAGATHPYGIDPRDRNIRIAPTFPPLDDILVATEVLAICIQLVAIDKM